MSIPFDNIIRDIERLPSQKVSGCVTSVLGILIEIGGIEGLVSIGDHFLVQARNGRQVTCEAVGFKDGQIRALPFGTLEGIGIGCRAEIGTSAAAIYPSDSWLGRVINAFEAIDGKGPLSKGADCYAIMSNLHRRISEPSGDKMDLGVRSMNTFFIGLHGTTPGYIFRFRCWKINTPFHDSASHNFGCQRYWSHRRTG